MKARVLFSSILALIAGLAWGQSAPVLSIPNTEPTEYLRYQGTLVAGEKTAEGTFRESTPIQATIPQGSLIQIKVQSFDFNPRISWNFPDKAQALGVQALGGAIDGQGGQVVETVNAAWPEAQKLVVSVTGAKTGTYQVLITSVPVVGTLKLDEAITGTMEQDLSEPDARLMPAWFRVETSPTNKVVIDAISMFDNSLTLVPPGEGLGTATTIDDVVQTNARVTINPMAPGAYAFVAVGVIENLGAQKRFSLWSQTKKVVTLKPNEVVTGVLDEHSEQVLGRAGDSFILIPEVGTKYQFRMTGDFDTYLSVQQEGGEVFENDDAQGGSALDLSFNSTKPVSVYAQVYSGAGSYQLIVASAKRLLNQPITINSTSPRNQARNLSNVYRYVGTPRTRVMITLSSPDQSADPYLVIRNSNGTSILGEDDDSGEYDWSSVVVELPSDGTIQIESSILSGPSSANLVLEIFESNQAIGSSSGGR